MHTEHIVEHAGVVTALSQTTVTVTIIHASACAACHLERSCPSSEKKQKDVIVETKPTTRYRIGQTVTLQMQESAGMHAVIVGYCIPLIIVVTTLFGMLTITHNEFIAGVIALISLIPYYGVLHLTRARLKKIFTCTIKEE